MQRCAAMNLNPGEWVQRVNILLYDPKTLYGKAMHRTILDLGHDCILYERMMKDYHGDAEVSMELFTLIHQNKVEQIWSFDYYPLLSMVAQAAGIVYVSWIYDCPLYTLMSKTVRNECNRIFCFDRIMSERIRRWGGGNVWHFPVGSMFDGDKITGGNENAGENGIAVVNEPEYRYDISFVGNFYQGEKNRLLHAEPSEYTGGFLQALIGTQKEVYGSNFVADALSEDVIREIIELCDLRLGDSYLQDDRQLVADAVNMLISNWEREEAILQLSEVLKDSGIYIDLFTGAVPDLITDAASIRMNGTVSYETQMPKIFRNSRINLNITSKSIESGISQRVIDILACGGFCLTNYQPEIAEFFADGEELVMYTSMADLVQKVIYYLEHDRERVLIAANGQKAVSERGWTLKQRTEGILRMLEE